MDISLLHCPMEGMVADYFTKLLQRSLFIKLQNFIIWAEYADEHQHTCRSVLDDEDCNSEVTSEQELYSEAVQSEASNKTSLSLPEYKYRME